MLSHMKWLALIAGIVVLGAAGTVACTGDDGEEADPTQVSEAVDTVIAVLATDTPEGQEPEATATEPPAERTAAADAVTTEGSCEHGEGESTLYIVFRNVEPGGVISGEITESPEGGLVDPATFEGTADDQGMVVIQKTIKRFGEYKWETEGGLTGNFTVEAECPGPPA